MSTSRPRTSCGYAYPKLKKHYPHCTAVWRKEDGCECAMEYGHRSESPEWRTFPTARQWRAERRKARRAWEQFRRDSRRFGWPEVPRR